MTADLEAARREEVDRLLDELNRWAESQRVPQHLYDQQILQSIRRRDGRDINGNLGDCLKTCVAMVLGVDPATVPHFAMSATSWFTRMRLHAASFGHDWACFLPDQMAEYWPLEPGCRVIASGRSPRGNFLHAVVVDHCSDLLHDPHPSHAGLASGVVDYLVLVRPYWPRPYVPALEAS